MHSLVEETSDRIIVEKLLQTERHSQGDRQTTEVGTQLTGNTLASTTHGQAAVSSDPLGLLRDLCKNSVRMLDSFKGPE